MFKELLPYLGRWFDQARIHEYDIPAEYAQLPEDALNLETLEAVFAEFMQRMQAGYPFHQPDYAGQMLKPPHPVAWLAYSMAMSVNTNNHALDGGPPTSQMEKEVVSDLCSMMGYDPETSLGHLSSGGTVANLEALWVAGCLHPGKKVLYSDAAHYTHARMCGVLDLPHEAVSLDVSTREQKQLLAKKLEDAGTLVVTLGTTGTGVVEPLHELLPMCRAAGVRIHVDAAYGGFFRLLTDTGLLDARPWKCIHEADSIVIDPHKHGLQPYGCGAVLFKEAAVGRFYKHDSPYTYFSSDELHLGEITLECSRAGAAAAAFWFTTRCFGLSPDSPFARMLADCLQAARNFADAVEDSDAFTLWNRPETDIVCYFPKAETAEAVTAASQALFFNLMQQGRESLFVSLFKVSAEDFHSRFPDIEIEEDMPVSLLRSVFMKPSHKAFIPEMMRRLEQTHQQLSEKP
jgi:glutamate/tyrosine decarboxylase-like PLP-dependent enzyme